MNDETKHKHLSNIFYDDKIGYGSAADLLKQVQLQGIKGINRQDVDNFVKNQHVKQVQKNRKQTYSSFVAEKPKEQYQIDLVFLNNKWMNNNYKCLLSCVDVFSKVGDIVPLKTKEKGEVTNAMESIIKKEAFQSLYIVIKDQNLIMMYF